MGQAMIMRVLLAVAVVGLAVPPALAEPQIGAVGQRAYLGAVGTRVTGLARNLYYDEAVFADERVDTGADSSTNLVFLDRTNLYVGAQSSVVLDRFVYDPASRHGDVAISFAKGAFRFITGQIKNKEAVLLRTPTAQLTIRGTELVIFVLADGTTEVNVIDGAVDVRVCNAGAPQRVERGQSILVAATCVATRGPVRDMQDAGPVPRMPIELATLQTKDERESIRPDDKRGGGRERSSSGKSGGGSSGVRGGGTSGGSTGGGSTGGGSTGGGTSGGGTSGGGTSGGKKGRS